MRARIAFSSSERSFLPIRVPMSAPVVDPIDPVFLPVREYALHFDGVDDFGAYWNVPIVDAGAQFNFIIHRGDEKSGKVAQAYAAYAKEAR